MAQNDDPASELARRCISSLLGVEVQRWDVPPRQGAYDLRYERSGQTVAVEVKSLIDSELRAAHVEADKTDYVQPDQLERSWTVYLDHAARWKRARQEVLELLRDLERLQWPGGGQLWRLRDLAPDTWHQAQRLGVKSASPTKPTGAHPPGFYLMPEGWGGGVPGIDALPQFCDDHLRSEAMSKLRAQLSRADTDERHAFFVVGWSHMIIDALSVASDAVPATAPELVRGVDAVWVTPTTTRSRVLAWLPDEGWLQGPAPTQGTSLPTNDAS